MVFINETNFDILICINSFEFVIRSKSECCFNENIDVFYVNAVPCKESKTKLKIPFAGINTFGSEHLICNLVCSCVFLVKNASSSSVIHLRELKTDSPCGVRYISLFVEGELVDISEMCFKVTDSSKAQRKYKFLLLFVVYGLILWICGTLFGLLSHDYIIATISIAAGVLSLIFYKKNAHKFDECVKEVSVTEEINDKIAESLEDEETLRMLDEIEQTKAKTKLEKMAVRAAKSLYKKLM